MNQNIKLPNGGDFCSQNAENHHQS